MCVGFEGACGMYRGEGVRVKYLAVYGRRGFVCVAAKEVSEYSIGVEFVWRVYVGRTC